MEDADRHVNYLADAVEKIVRGASTDTTVRLPRLPRLPRPSPPTRALPGKGGPAPGRATEVGGREDGPGRKPSSRPPERTAPRGWSTGSRTDPVPDGVCPGRGRRGARSSEN